MKKILRPMLLYEKLVGDETSRNAPPQKKLFGSFGLQMLSFEVEAPMRQIGSLLAVTNYQNLYEKLQSNSFKMT